MPSLTKSFVDDVSAPDAGYKIHWHDTIKGFGLRVTERGRKTFVAQGRVRGLPVCVTLGAYGVYTPKTAEDTARKLLQQMREGIDPRDVRRREAKSKSPTLRALADEYMARPGKLKARSKEQIDRHVRTTFKDMEHCPISEITEGYCIERYEHMRDHGLHGNRTDTDGKRIGSPGQANQSHTILKALMNYAIRKRKGIDKNPCDAVTKDDRVTLKPRTAYIKPAKIGGVWNWLKEQRAQAYTQLGMGRLDLVIFLLLTGARIGEANELTWDRVSLDGEEPWWHLPDPKNRNPIWLPLSTQAVAMLRVRRDEVPKNVRWVFASDRSKSGHIEDPREMWPAISKVAGEPISAHDLRRSFTNYGFMELNLDYHKIELLTGHKPTSVTLRHYTETSRLERLQPEVQKIADFIERKAAIAAGSNVVELPARKTG